MSEPDIQAANARASRPNPPPCEACKGSGAASTPRYTISDCAVGGYQVTQDADKDGGEIVAGPSPRPGGGWIDLELHQAAEIADALNADPDENPCKECQGTGDDTQERENPADSD